jgi:hypothetical protein
MEQLKVKKKDIIVTNSIVFLALSFLFLYLQYAYRHQLSPFSLIYLKKSAELFWYVAIPVLASMVLIWKHHKMAKSFFAFSIMLVTFKVVEGLFIEFNKIIVVALFFFVVIAYFLHQLLSTYFNSASINPNYSAADLFDPLLKKIPCTLSGIPGSLTNWDEEGCFVLLDSGKFEDATVNVVVNFKGRDFVQQGEVISKTTDGKGVGIRFVKTPKGLNVFNWSEFTDLVYELGYQPERLR